MTHIAFLRGINVGGKAVLPMKDLISAFSAAGATGVQTYIQSGNVLFSGSDPGAIAAAVTKEIASRFGYPGRIVLRSAEELQACLGANPFVRAGAGVETLHVYLLADQPSAAAVKALDPERSPGDSFVVRGREVYLHVPQGMARTKLTNVYFDSKLKTVSTARNWKTITTLAGLASAKASDLSS